MEKTNLLTLVVTLTVGIILAGSLLMPVLSDATTTEKTLTNDGLFEMKAVDATTDFTLEWDYTTPNQITVNDEVVELTKGQFALTVFFTEDLIFRHTWSDSISVYETANNSTSPVIIASVGFTRNLTASCEDGTLTVIAGATTKTSTMTSGMIAATDGTHVMKDATATAYLLDNSEFYGAGYTSNALNAASTNFLGIFKGTIDGGITIISQVPEDYELSNIEQNYTQIQTSTYKELYGYTSFEYDLTDGENTGHVTYSQIVVPKEINAELAQHLEDASITLLNALPILIIIGLVLAGVGAIFFRNRD